jgi:hypothetical protein
MQRRQVATGKLNRLLVAGSGSRMTGPLNEVWKMSPSTNSPSPCGSARDLPSVAETVESTVSCHESCSRR